MFKTKVLYKNQKFIKPYFDDKHKQISSDNNTTDNNLLWDDPILKDQFVTMTKLFKGSKKSKKKSKEKLPTKFKQHPRNLPSNDSSSVSDDDNDESPNKVVPIYKKLLETNRLNARNDEPNSSDEELLYHIHKKPQMFSKVKQRFRYPKNTTAPPSQYEDLINAFANPPVKNVKNKSLKKNQEYPKMLYEEDVYKKAQFRSKKKPHLHKNIDTSFDILMDQLPSYKDNDDYDCQLDEEDVITELKTVTENTEEEKTKMGEDDTTIIDENLPESTVQYQNTKLNEIFVKISRCLQDIKIGLDGGIVPFESVDDQMRRERRILGFFSHFSRNYLYQFGRQAEIVKRLMNKPMTGLISVFTFYQKLFNLVTLILHTLRAYIQHIRSTVPSIIHSKFSQVLVTIDNLCASDKKIKQLYGININSSVVLDIQEHIKTIIPLIDEHLVIKETPGTEKKEKDLAVVSVVRLTKPRAKLTVPFHKKNSIESRLKMYTVGARSSQSHWKKNAAILAKQKLQKLQAPAVKTPTEPPTKDDNKLNLHIRPATSPKDTDERKTSSEILNSNDKNQVDSDDIETMVENKKPIEVMSMAEDEIKNKLEPLLRNLISKFTKQSTDESVDHRTLDKLHGLMTQIKLFGDNKNENTKNLESSVLSITGTKNARLICIADKTCNETTSDLEGNQIVPKSGPNYLSCLPKDFTVGIVRYKLQFNKFRRENQLYKKSVTRKIITKICEDMLKFLLLEVLKEMQLNKIANKVYKSEFILH